MSNSKYSNEAFNRLVDFIKQYPDVDDSRAEALANLYKFREETRTNTIKAAIEALPEKRPLVNSRPAEWDDHYHTKWNATQEGFNESADQAESNLKALIGGDDD